MHVGKLKQYVREHRFVTLVREDSPNVFASGEFEQGTSEKEFGVQCDANVFVPFHVDDVVDVQQSDEGEVVVILRKARLKLGNQESAESIVQTLRSLLETGKDALTPENFATNRTVIEQVIFPAAMQLGFNVNDIVADYQLELVQSSGGPDHPSVGRLYYIKEHLQKLLDRISAKAA